MSRPDIQPVLEFLKVDTPTGWINSVASNVDLLLIDHANCEKKAANSALSIIFRYVEYPGLIKHMSKLAREELRHFEQVIDLMLDLEVEYKPLSPSRYASALHKEISKEEPYRLIDTLICAAVVEARSCERFAAVSGEVPAKIAEFYRFLLNSEARHFRDYIELACSYAKRERRKICGDYVDKRTEVFLDLDTELITRPDEEFRFHSGPVD
jgi:tRNA-(ms[2]io[6]A)-hydroxylase